MRSKKPHKMMKRALLTEEKKMDFRRSLKLQRIKEGVSRKVKEWLDAKVLVSDGTSGDVVTLRRCHNVWIYYCHVCQFGKGIKKFGQHWESQEHQDRLKEPVHPVEQFEITQRSNTRFTTHGSQYNPGVSDFNEKQQQLPQGTVDKLLISYNGFDEDETKILNEINLSGQSFENSDSSGKGEKQISEVTIIDVLRQLSVLEDQLGSLGPKVVNLLSKAILLEKSSNTNSLLFEEENCLLLETAKEKLKGILQNGLIQHSLIGFVESVIKNVTYLINKVNSKNVIGFSQKSHKELPHHDQKSCDNGNDSLLGEGKTCMGENSLYCDNRDTFGDNKSDYHDEKKAYEEKKNYYPDVKETDEDGKKIYLDGKKIYFKDELNFCQERRTYNDHMSSSPDERKIHGNDGSSRDERKIHSNDGSSRDERKTFFHEESKMYGNETISSHDEKKTFCHKKLKVYDNEMSSSHDGRKIHGNDGFSLDEGKTSNDKINISITNTYNNEMNSCINERNSYRDIKSTHYNEKKPYDDRLSHVKKISDFKGKELSYRASELSTVLQNLRCLMHISYIEILEISKKISTSMLLKGQNEITKEQLMEVVNAYIRDETEKAKVFLK